MSEYNGNNGNNGNDPDRSGNPYDWSDPYSANSGDNSGSPELDLYDSFYRPNETQAPVPGPLDYTESGDIRFYDGGWRTRRVRRHGWGWVFATVALAAFIAGAALMRFLPALGTAVFPAATHTATARVTAPAATERAQTLTPRTLSPESTLPAIGGDKLILEGNADIPAIVEADSPAVVGVLNNVNYRNSFGFSSQGQNVTQSSGSGVIISTDGYIVTNNHVVEGADSLSVVLSGGEEVAAHLVGADAQTDIAVIKIDKTGLTAIPIGNSDSVRVGETVLAIGNPLGQELAGTVTMGIISAKNREIQNDGYTFKLLQTDAAINPGNSGGALVDMKGDLIGINQMKITTSEVDENGTAISAEGIGFAIPINVAQPIVLQLMRSGYIPRPMLGIDSAQEISNYASRRYRMPVGIYLERLTPGGPAEKAGIRNSDVLVKLDGRATPTLADMNEALSARSIGDTVQAEVWRDGGNMTFKVTLEGLSQ